MKKLKKICLVVIIGVLVIALREILLTYTIPTSIVILSNKVRIGDTFNVSIQCNPTEPVKAWEFKLKFDKNIVQVTKISEGNLFQEFDTFFNPGIIDNTNGTVINMYDLIIGKGTVQNSGSTVIITMYAINRGTSNLELYDVGVTNESTYIPISYTNSSITVYGEME